MTDFDPPAVVFDDVSTTVPRKKVTNPRGKIVHASVSTAVRDAWQAAADRDGRSLSDWLARRGSSQSATPPAQIAPSGKTVIVGARVSTAVHKAWVAAAKADGRSLSAWLVRRANSETATAPLLPPEPPPKPRSRSRKS